MRASTRARRGLTLSELLIASTIMVMIAAAVATLGATAHSSNGHCQGQTVAAQHARVVLQRIEHAVRGAFASEAFPMCLVVTEQVGGQQLPDSLVVWEEAPPGAAANDPHRRPLHSELVVFTPDPTHPNALLEIRSTSGATSPPPADTSGWRNLVEQLRTSSTSEKTVLTDRLRTTPITGDWNDSLTANQLRAVIRFRRLMAPDMDGWSGFRQSNVPKWHELAWPLDNYGADYGTRTVVCQTEFQLVTSSRASAAATALPFFGSSSLSYILRKNPTP